jgi:hypothetical protein
MAWDSNAIGMASKSMRRHAMRAAMDLDDMGQHGIGQQCHCMLSHAIQIHCRPVVCCQCNWQNLALPLADFLYFQAMCFAATVNAEFLIFSLRSFAASVIAGIWQCRISKCLGECRICKCRIFGIFTKVFCRQCK